MDKNEIQTLVYTLNRLQALKNNSRGISCVQTILSYLEQGEIDCACAVAANEWDKISAYQDIAELLVLTGVYTPINFVGKG